MGPFVAESSSWHFCVNTQLNILTNQWLLLWSQAASFEKTNQLGPRGAVPGKKMGLIPPALTPDPYLEFRVSVFYTYLSLLEICLLTFFPSLCSLATHKFIFLARHAAKFQSSKWPEWKPLNSHRFNHWSKLEPFVVRFWWRSIKISAVPLHFLFKWLSEH
jgi:hypothetical protein